MFTLTVALVLATAISGSLSDDRDNRIPKYECQNGWSQIIGNEFTQWGAMKSMTGPVLYSNVTGKTMHIYGYRQWAGAYVYFESKDAPKNILFYMHLDLPNSQIKLSSRKDGKWKDETVVSISLRCCSPGYYPQIHYYWMVELTFGLENGQQYINIVNRNEGTVVHQFYPEDPVEPNDRYYFIQDSYNVLGVTWSTLATRRFPSGLPIDNEIHIIGKITELPIEINMVGDRGEVTGGISVSVDYVHGSGKTMHLYTQRRQGYFESGTRGAEFYKNNLTVIVIRRTPHGIQVWHKGYRYAYLYDGYLTTSEIREIRVVRGFEVHGMSVLDC